jgi:BirA family transcriptional regulator, biotin operon repressor / biotin---[acetyl-CoA-carboxylase] ligase
VRQRPGGHHTGRVASPYGDLHRPPLHVRALQRALEPDGWRVEVLAEAGSTNAVVADRARAGEPAGLVVVTEHQTAGRGRLDRSWHSPARAGLTFSALLRPGWPPADWPWIPLLAGLAVTRVVRELGELDAALKWPNDVLVAGRKLCGVLAEVPAPGAAVVGIGLNVSTRRDELPADLATSLVLEGAATTDRDTLLRAVLRALRDVLAAPLPAREEYRRLCGTLGRRVRVELPGQEPVLGTAQAVDGGGRLVVDGVPFGAGDVVHARPVSP